MAFGASNTFPYPGSSQPRKVVEMVTERKFDEDGNVTWEKITETERWVHDSPPGSWWQQPTVTYTTGSHTKL